MRVVQCRVNHSNSAERSGTHTRTVCWDNHVTRAVESQPTNIADNSLTTRSQDMCREESCAPQGRTRGSAGAHHMRRWRRRQPPASPQPPWMLTSSPSVPAHATGICTLLQWVGPLLNSRCNLQIWVAQYCKLTVMKYWMSAVVTGRIAQLKRPKESRAAPERRDCLQGSACEPARPVARHRPALAWCALRTTAGRPVRVAQRACPAPAEAL